MQEQPGLLRKNRFASTIAIFVLLSYPYDSWFIDSLYRRGNSGVTFWLFYKFRSVSVSLQGEVFSRESTLQGEGAGARSHVR